MMYARKRNFKWRLYYRPARLKTPKVKVSSPEVRHSVSARCETTRRTFVEGKTKKVQKMAEKKKKGTNSSSLIPEQSSHTVREREIRSQLGEQKSVADIMSECRESWSLYAAPSAASEKIHAVPAQPVLPPSRVSPSVSVNSYSSMTKLPSFQPQKTQSAPLCIVIPSVPVNPSMLKPPDSHLQKTQREPLRKTDSSAPSVSTESDESIERPINFNRQETLSQLTEEPSSCVVCGPERPCSCLDQCSSTAGYSFERSERDQELQSALLEKTIKKVEMETEKLQAEKEKSQAEKEKLQAEKEKLQAEKEKLQAEKEKSQAEKEKLELEKRKLALEIQLLEQQGKYTNYDHGVNIPNKGLPYIPYM